ncbi:CarD family transcriptional regulator [Thermospira aquatica]|uniref:CarD family transcriptional regulator n=1 Tax=Thermospira aquatica TaxID=2828656 RepID=A0AAX3BC03_9SPIR|nr:CarD family transcriptional regulator [Thermospira aquatica]URA09785.1 CarD family transcriptional regulator [Thermospira aquatica]
MFSLYNTRVGVSMFKIGDKVFYPYHGAGEITNVEEKEIFGEKKLYYIIKFPLTETTVMLPADNPDQLGLRFLATPLEIKYCLDKLKNINISLDDDWKIRYKRNQDLLKSGNIDDVAMVVKTLYLRNKHKELSTTEKKLYQNAMNILISEIALALEKTLDEVKEEILRILGEEKR